MNAYCQNFWWGKKKEHCWELSSSCVLLVTLLLGIAGYSWYFY